VTTGDHVRRPASATAALVGLLLVAALAILGLGVSGGVAGAAAPDLTPPATACGTSLRQAPVPRFGEGEASRRHRDLSPFAYDRCTTHIRDASVLLVPDGEVSAAQSEANVVMGRKGVSKTFVDDAGRSTTVKYGGEMIVEPGTNVPGIVNGRNYSGHAFDQMQARGIMPSAVDDTVATGVGAGSRGGTTVYYGAGNDISVVVNADGKVVTVSYGDLRP